MKREEFLEKLRRKLMVLKDDEIADIIDEYGSYIDEKIKKGKTEEEAIKEFGNFDELVSEILSAYKIDNEKDVAKNIIMNFFDDIAKTFERIVQDLSNKDFNGIMKFVIELFLILIIIALCKWPVELIIHLGRDIFSILPNPFYMAFYGLWRFILEFAYLILAIFVFVKIFKERFLKKEDINSSDKYTKAKTVKDVKEIKKKAKEQKEEINETINEGVYDNYIRDENPKARQRVANNSMDFATNVMLMICKIFVIIFLIPSFSILLGLIIALSICVGLFISGVHYFGILLCIIAMVIFGIIFVELMFNFVFNRRVKGTKIFISLIATMFMLGAGITITTFEVANSSYINEVPSRFVPVETDKEFNSSDIDYIRNMERVEFVVDDDLTDDKVKITTVHYENFTNPVIELYGKTLELYNFEYDVFPSKKLYTNVIDNLKRKEIYNYGKLYTVEFKIYGTATTIERLKDTRINSTISDLEEALEQKQSECDEWQTKYYDLLGRHN